MIKCASEVIIEPGQRHRQPVCSNTVENLHRGSHWSWNEVITSFVDFLPCATKRSSLPMIGMKYYFVVCNSTSRNQGQREGQRGGQREGQREEQEWEGQREGQ